MHVVGIYSSDYFLSLFYNLNLDIFWTFLHLESDLPVGGIVFHKHSFWFLLYPPQNEVLGGYTVFSLSVIPSFRQHFDIFAE